MHNKNKSLPSDIFWYVIFIIISVITNVLVMYYYDLFQSFTYIRIIIGLLYVFYLPGNLIYRTIIQLKHETFMEELINSIILSIFIVIIIGLILNSLLIKINFTSSLLSLSTVILILSIIGLIKSLLNK